METMTIHRALIELKLIDDKISKKTQQIEPVASYKDDKVGGVVSVSEFESNAKATFQSINDLIERKIKIKAAIVESNGVQIVNIGGISMTVADAINRKAIISAKKELVSTLHRKSMNVLSSFRKENERIENLALENAKIMLGKQGDTAVKPTDDDVKAIMVPFVDRNSLKFSDPLDILKTIDSLNAEIELFEANVDACLSESNALTTIVI